MKLLNWNSDCLETIPFYPTSHILMMILIEQRVLEQKGKSEIGPEAQGLT